MGDKNAQFEILTPGSVAGLILGAYVGAQLSGTWNLRQPFAGPFILVVAIAGFIVGAILNNKMKDS